MSNQLYMDETNGNGVYATKSNTMSSLSGTATVTTNNVSNNINVIMSAASTSTITAATLPTSVSSEDLSQSLSEYTDADESISAPTEFLAEFLSAVMLKDYKKALKYCKLILQYEPNNSTAKEFYPLILDKLRGAELSDSDENYNKSSSPEGSFDHNLNACEVAEPISRMDDGADEYGVSEDDSSGEPHSNYSPSSCSPEESFSELLDNENEEDDDEGEDQEDDDDDDDDNDDDHNEVYEDDDEDDKSSSGDDLPIDEPQEMEDCGGCGNTTDAGRASNSSSGGEGRSRSDNTTHSYSSLLLEEEEADTVPNNLHFTKNLSMQDLDVSNGNKVQSASCSDSESPTEPLTQRLAAILRSTCGVSHTSGDTK